MAFLELEADGFKFQFKDAMSAYIFDEKDSQSSTFHGGFMKGVDIIAEYESAYVFIEMKDYDAIKEEYNIKNIEQEQDEARKESVRKNFKWLKNYLKYKFRDTYLYRYAEGKVEKPVHYFCLVTFEDALNNVLKKSLTQELPIGKKGKRWVQELAKSCQVLNIQTWNRNFAHENETHRTFFKCTVMSTTGAQ